MLIVIKIIALFSTLFQNLNFLHSTQKYIGQKTLYISVKEKSEFLKKDGIYLKKDCCKSDTEG